MKKIILIVLAVVVVAVAVVAIYADRIAAGGIERGSEYAVGQNTSVGRVNLGVLSGSFGMSSFVIDNPEGFESDHFLAMRSADLSVGLRSVMADTVVIERLALDGIDLNVEMRNRDGNWGPILDHLKQFETKGGGKSKQSDGKRFVIDELVITDVSARVSAKSPELGIDKETSVEVPEIRLSGVGRKTGGVMISELASIVLTRVLDAVARSGGDLPGQLRSAIRKETAILIDQQGPLVADAKQAARQAAEEAGKDLVDEAKKKLDDLLD